MSSSGLIYAVIVGAWAIYLVPMWLRREDELNHARQTQRYATAIKVLANKDSFERRWSAADEAEDELPLAAGQGPVAPRRGPAPTAAAVKPMASTQAPARTEPSGSRPTVQRGGRISSFEQQDIDEAETARIRPARPAPKATAAGAVPASSRRPAVTTTTTARIARTSTVGSAPAASAAAGAAAQAESGNRSTAAPRQRQPQAKQGPSSGLVARRRRVVSLLFAASTLGTIVTADLGSAYLWAMLIPALLLSAYIVRLRKDERSRAADQRARRAGTARSTAQASRHTERPGAQDPSRHPADEAPSGEDTEPTTILPIPLPARPRQVVVRRRTAAARSREVRYTQQPAPEAADLRRAANS